MDSVNKDLESEFEKYIRRLEKEDKNGVNNAQGE